MDCLPNTSKPSQLTNAMPENARLSLCMPTHLPLDGCQQSLDNLRGLAGVPGLETVISDNSGDPRKRAHCLGISDPGFRYFISQESDAPGNFAYCLNHARGDFVSFVSDDDLILPLPGFSATDFPVQPGDIGFRPLMALYTESLGIYSITNYSIDGDRAIDRVKQYIDLNGGANTTLFSCFKTEVLSALFRDFMKYHPTRGGYTDWTTVLGLLSMGPLPAYPKMLYVYNNRNWTTQEKIHQNTLNTFMDAGLPAGAVKILDILHALDGFTMVARAQSPISAEEKLEAAIFVMDSFIHSFIQKLGNAAYAASLVPGRVSLVHVLLEQSRSPIDRLAACLLIIEEWLPGYSEKYRVYMRSMLDPALQSILE